MRPSRRRFRAIRTSRLEQIEPRLLMSGEPAGDFFVDYFVESGPTDQIHAFLSDAHDLTGLTEVRADYGFRGTGQTVVVIDTGIAYDHTSLGGGFGPEYRVVGGFDFTEENDADPYDDGPYGSHGTHVAGIIGSSNQFNQGVAPGVDLVGLRVFDDNGAGCFTWLEDALAWVHTNRNTFENPITAVNLSLGTSWNSDSLPAWAILEDELAQLEADGIFISVAAGNSFARYDEPGLSYPSVSSHVVPVSSVDSNGEMSYFSQRHQRVIAAPGRSVLSTVPDYVGDGNGINDDFARYSGTSMASPYVAGASVLLREAYQFVGLQEVAQDTIYELMRNTADTVLDPATGQAYCRLNLQRAIDAIMPADDFGSSATTAYSLGTLSNSKSRSLSGTVGKLDDSDWFTFAAAQTGNVVLTVDTAGNMLPDWRFAEGMFGDGPSKLQLAGGTLSFDVIAGGVYTVGLGTRTGLGHYSIDFGLDAEFSYTDWGTIRQQQFLDNQISGDGQWFAFTAADDGILPAEAFFSHADGNVDLELFDAQRQLLAGSYGTVDAERVDVEASAGETFFLHAFVGDGGSGGGQVDLRLTNLVTQDGTAVTVRGTAGDDDFTFAAGAVHCLTINGVAYQFDAAAAGSVAFDGLGGSDTAILTGTAGADRGILRVGSAELTGSQYRVVATGVETITARGAGGTDVVRLYDSPGDDTLIGTPTRSTLYGDGFHNTAEGFRYVHAYGNAGGKDVAELYDSAGNDVFVATPIQGNLYGERFYVRAKRFRYVHAYSTAGGNDVAKMYDSAGDDVLIVTPTESTLYGNRFFARANNFRYVHTYARAGGNDVARMYDSSGNDVLVVTPTCARLSGSGFYARAKYFEQVFADGNAGGFDKARLYDSAVDDYFQGAADRARLSNDRLTVAGYGFEHVRAHADRGGVNTTELAAVDYILELLGEWS